jgi:autotransporter-associated beta strand protein
VGLGLSVRLLSRAILALIAALPVIGVTTEFARAQQYFNGAQTIPNAAINGGSGVWDNTTTNWTNATGTASNPYDPSAPTITIFGASGFSTPATGGTVTVGAGGVVLTGDVQFQATGDNSIYTIQGGNLTVATGGTTFEVSNVSGGASPSAVVSSGIVGSNSITVTGPGVLALAGSNTYSGGTTVSGFGTLQVTDNSSVGTGTVTLQDGLFQASSRDLTFSNNFRINNTAAGSAIDTNGVTLTIAGNITDGNGPGALTVLDSFGGGRVILTGTNTYSGGTTICSCGTLQLGTLATMGSIVGAVTNEGVFNIINANTAGITSILNEGGGSTVFRNTSSASSINITNNTGTTVFGRIGGSDISTAGNAIIDNNNGGTIFAANSNAGVAKITNRNGGGTIFGDNASAASATITTNDTGFTVFNGHSNGGNAQFITNDSGFVDFSGTSGPGGLHQISAGSIAGSGFYDIGGGNTLIVGSNNLSTEVSGVIDDGCGCSPGSGNLTKIGTGTLTLSGTNAYTGETVVNGGTLLVTGSIASSSDVKVSNGATLAGTGTVSQTSLFNGAMLAPGLPTALGTLTVNDQLVFHSSTFYDVKVTSAGNDLTMVVPGSLFLGVAGLAGTVQVTSLNSSYRFNSPYTILTAQGGFGATVFDSLVTPTGINGSLSYTLTDVNLMLLSALGQLPGLNVNQHNVANALDTVFNTTGNSGSLGAIFNGNIPQNLSQVSGETATGTQQATFNAMNLFLGLLTDPFIDGRGGPNPAPAGAQPFADESASAYAARKQNAARDAFAKFPTKADVARNDLLDPHWSVWGAAYGGGSTTDGNAALGSNSSTARAFGFAAGTDYRISPSTLAGFALAGGGTNFSVNGFGTGRSDLFQAGAFVRHNIGAAYVSGALAYGWQDVTTDRTVTVAGLDRLHAEFNANAISGRIESGYRYLTPWMGVTPYAAGQFTSYSLPAYAEQALVGTNAFALNYAAKDVTASRTELGVRTDRSFAIRDAILTLRSRLAWAHDFNTDRNISAVFQTLPGASFVVNGAAQAHDSALTTVSAEARWLNGWTAAATFEGEFSEVTRSYAGKGVVRYAW